MKILNFLGAACITFAAAGCHDLIGETAEIINNPGWHDWANESNVPHAPAAMNAYYTRARCLCGGKFSVVYSGDRKTFKVVKAPMGFSDTVGQWFVAKERNCYNCAD